ncbi:YdaU family protein [Paraburkholderia tropica]|uniref:YdaU family protein n=1 Tax=Paraburkholderia tropica TaxID=92647 RepID=UPI002AB75550|nr:DUF1376 domain-containing protein [Paraburkholderia tropica]
MSDEEKVKVWMPLFIGAYLADTQRLSTEQHGAYLLLIMDYWMNGAPADDDEELAQITKLSLSAWKKTKVKIVKFFTLQDGHWHHKRIEKELTDARSRKEQSNAKAKAAADARWSKHRAKQSSEDSLSGASRNAPSMLQALQEAVPGAMPEGMHDQCPIPLPLPTPFETEGTNTARSETGVGGAGVVPMSAGLLSRVMREFGIQSNPADPRLIACAEQRVLPETVRAACEDAKRSKPNERIAPAYVLAIIERWARDAKEIDARGAQGPAKAQGKQSRHSGFDKIDYREGVNEDGSF